MLAFPLGDRRECLLVPAVGAGCTVLQQVLVQRGIRLRVFRPSWAARRDRPANLQGQCLAYVDARPSHAASSARRPAGRYCIVSSVYYVPFKRGFARRPVRGPAPSALSCCSCVGTSRAHAYRSIARLRQGQAANTGHFYCASRRRPRRCSRWTPGVNPPPSWLRSVRRRSSVTGARSERRLFMYGRTPCRRRRASLLFSEAYQQCAGTTSFCCLPQTAAGSSRPIQRSKDAPANS